MSSARSGTVIGLLLAHAESHPEAAAFINSAGTLTYGELARNAGSAAAWLAERGIAPGDSVALSLSLPPPDTRGALELLYGLAWLGALAIPIFPDVPAGRRAQIAARYGARLVETSDYPRGERIPPRRGDAPEKPFVVQFTSGTTGEPKALRLTHEQVVQRAFSQAEGLGLLRGDRLLGQRPWPALVGMRHLLRLHCVGAAYVNLKFPATRRELSGLIAAHDIAHVHTAPLQMRVLMQEPGDLIEVRTFFVGGAPVSAHEARQAREQLCRTLYINYGVNEAGTVAVLRPEDPVADGRVGRLLPGVQCESPGGELRFRAPGMSLGYLDNPAASAARFRDGWFYPGDLGSIDADGFLTVRGRTDDVINYGGTKILPAEIEAVLLEHPEVLDAAVVGIADGRAGAVPVAFLVTRRAGAEPAIREFCRQRVDGARAPIAYVRISVMPRNDSGKVDCEQLRRLPIAEVLPRERPTQ